MTPLIVSLSLISALTAASSALSCTQCISTSVTCSGNSVTCPSGYMCGSTYTRALFVGVSTESLVRGCTPSSKCSFIGTMSITGGHTDIGISCCSTDGCTPTLPTFPTKSSKLNGVTCPSCISVQSASCDTSNTVQCTGDENMCFLQTTEITALQGCATQSICDHGQSPTFEGSTVKATYTCTSGGISIYKVILTPNIVCLLLLKLFL